MKNKKTTVKLLLLAAIAVLLVIFFVFDLGQYLTLDYLKSQRQYLQDQYTQYPLLALFIFAIIYILVTALSLPGAAIMTLAGGAIFGLLKGVIVVSVASTIGATLAFLCSRFFLKDYVQSKFARQLEPINKGVAKEGAFFLFTMRLIPAFPFFLVNLAMGLTKIRTLTFFFVSQLGMLPGTVVFVNAGYELGKLDSLSGILSPNLLISFALIGIAPFIFKSIIEYVRGRKYIKKYKKPKTFDYNVVAIGAGSGGLVASYIAAAVKAKVALIERHKMGGDCLNTGCVPSKALIRSAKMIHYYKNSEKYGIKSVNCDYEFADVMERVQSVIKKIEPHDSVERYTQLGVDCIQGDAKILSPYEVQVDGRILKTKNIIIATGARPFVPPIEGLDQVPHLTSDTIWNLRQRPEKLVVLGGGPIGSELAQSFQRLGSQVTIVELGPSVMGREDKEICEAVMEQFKKDGMNVLTHHKAHRFVKEGEKNFLICQKSQNTKENQEAETVKVEFDQVLIALGRRANVSGFGLEELDVKLTERGTIEADEFLRTNYPNIYACGDVAGPYQFTHTAAHQAWYASVNALFSPVKKFKVDYSVIPWATFTDPEVARVGLNEKEANEKDIKYEVTTYGIDDLDRAIADGTDSGIVKVLTQPGSDRILGVTIMGHHSGDLIAEFILAMKYKIGLNKILGTIHIYPTNAEMNKYVAGNWKRAHAPEGLLEWIKKWHTWRRN